MFNLGFYFFRMKRANWVTEFLLDIIECPIFIDLLANQPINPFMHVKKFLNTTGNSFFILSSSIEKFPDYREQDSFKIFWCTKGIIELEVDLEKVHVKENQVLSLGANQHIGSVNGGEGIVYQYNRDFYCIVDHDKEISCVGLLYYGSNRTPVLTLDEKHQRKFELLHQVFEDEFDTVDNIQESMLRMLLKRLIIICTRLLKEQYPFPTEEPELEIIRQFHILLELNFKTKQTVAQYADMLYKSPKTLANLFAKNNEKPPLKQIQNRITLEAKRMLRFTDKPIKEISWELNFGEVAHFSRFFKRNTGLAPTEFRGKVY